MTSRRSNRVSASAMKRTPKCAICTREVNEKILIGERYVCFQCAWETMTELGRIYNAPEISAVDRMKHRQEHGADGFKRNPIEPGWVYYILIGDRIKIGYAKDVKKRMRAYPPNASLLAAHPGTPEVERQMQKRFNDHLAHGREWFVDAAEIREHVASVIAQFGPADHMAYEYTRPKTEEEKVAAMFTTRNNGSVARGPHFVI